VEVCWTARLPVSADREVSIQARRRQDGHYTVKLPLDNADIQLSDSAEPIHMGPNVIICAYRDHTGETIRGASPPDERYLSEWLTDNHAPTTAAAAISGKIAEVFDESRFNQGGPGADWTVTQNARTNPLAWVATISVMIFVWLAGVWWAAIPRRNGPERTPGK
jgi:hypothetical protein